jgi:cob(I)alamin adenosyltransferase
MVTLSKIYTRGGDKGQTSLGSGERVDKHNLRVAAYGTTDETNSIIGIARLHTTGVTDEMLSRIQNDLFDLGADLCTPESANRSEGALRVVPEQVSRLETEIDAMNENMTDLSSFILPGGSPASAYLHLARTVARRAERLMTKLATNQQVNPEAVKYMNRISDHLFVLARYLNDTGKADILWVPGKNR